MVSRINDYSFFDDAAIQKIAKAVANESKLVQIYEDAQKANIMKQQLRIQGYHAKVEKHNNSFYVIATTKDMVPYIEAMKSGQFTKLAFGRYSFIRQSNNSLGFQKYDFDDGTIWKIMTDKNGRDYLVKEVDDNDEDKVVRLNEEDDNSNNLNNDDNEKTASLTEDDCRKICRVLYDTTNDKLTNEFLSTSPDKMKKLLVAKLNNFVENEVKASKFISAPKYINALKQKVLDGIIKDAIFNKNQISKLILNANAELLK